MKRQLTITIEVDLPAEVDHTDYDPMEVASVHVTPEEVLVSAEWKP